MKHLPVILAVIGVVLAFAFIGCNASSEPDEGRSESESGERRIESESGEGRSGSESGEHNSVSESGEHSSESESGEHRSESESGEGGEESGAQFALSETFDSIRAGARLVLSYDSTANAFTGTVENTTEDTLRRVRVEVHLSNGIELGPTTPVDLAPGETVDINLPASSQPFTSWSAHPEVD